ncbi:hypothetical protein LCGC14_0258480 [marine sediment metagenome]|uniref:Uncharacterized protein n=1 Tax=marine sediment metagenome TaxID=412755 RepID=A0A0F9X745_9ZZZZ
MSTTSIEVIEKSHRPPSNFGSFLEVVQPRLQTVLPAHINAETLIRVVQASGNQNEQLLKCTESSLLTSLMLCSQLGLPPNTPQGFSWLIPFWNGRQKLLECKVMFGKNGLAQLVRNSGEVHRMNSGVVYKHEAISGAFTHTNEPPTINHRSDILADPALYADKNLVAAYALIVTKDGAQILRVLRRDEVLKRRDSSQAVKAAKKKGYSTPWDDWEAPMWVKTAIRALCGMPEVPTSTDLVTALEKDIDSPDFAELQQVTTPGDGFRQQAALGATTVIDTPALPAGDTTPAPAAATEPEPEKPQGDGATKPKKATKVQTGRLWGRWAKITDCDPKAPADVDKESFRGFVAHRIGEDKAKDSSSWTVDDCKVIGKGLDDLRDGKPAGPPADKKEPPAPAESAPEPAAEPAPTTEEDPPKPEISKSDALKQLKDLKKVLSMEWDEVRDLAGGVGVTFKNSSKWTVPECLEVIEAMKATIADDPTEDPPPAANGEQPETSSDPEGNEVD